MLTSFHDNVSLDLEDARLVDVLKMLSQQIKLNFISTEAIRDRKITVYMENVPLREALDVIFKANNLAYDYYPDANMFVVKEMGKPDLERKAKIYRLKYVRVKSSRLQQEIENSMELDGGSSTRGGSGRYEGIKNAVESILTENGRVTEDPITNSLIVVDVPSQFPAIDEIIAKLDIATPKVMIEVEMLDVSKTHLDQMGFNWANGLWARGAAGARNTTFPLGRAQYVDRFNIHDIGNTNNDPGILNAIGSTQAAPILGILDLTNLSVVMQFLTQDTSTKFLARPKILTLSDETAEVKLTVNEAIGVETVTTEAGNVNENIEREETGTKLRVTPHVNPFTQEVTLFIEMFNRESVDSGLATTRLTVGEIKNVEERGTKSTVRLKNGETLYIGGLIRRESQETITKIPFLGDIPLIGRLFSYTERPGGDNQDRELLVFLTPRVIEERPVVSAKPAVFLREQQNIAKRQSVKTVLDGFMR